jgi:hypothetical protein
VVLDDTEIAPVEGACSVPLLRDGGRHTLKVTLGSGQEKTS